MQLIELQSRYATLVNIELPSIARDRRFPIWLNHCFGRVILDNLFGGCRYDFLSRKKPAYKQLSIEQLQEAIVIAESMFDRDVVINLNNKSLQ